MKENERFRKLEEARKELPFRTLVYLSMLGIKNDLAKEGQEEWSQKAAESARQWLERVMTCNDKRALFDYARVLVEIAESEQANRPLSG